MSSVKGARIEAGIAITTMIYERHQIVTMAWDILRAERPPMTNSAQRNKKIMIDTE